MYRRGMFLLLLLQITLGLGFFCTTEVIHLEKMTTPVAQIKLDERLLADEKEKALGIINSAASNQRVVAYSTLSKENKVGVLLSERDYEVLLRIVEAEAGGEDAKGKILVANVVLNRVRDDAFPSTVEEVVFQHSDKVYQFSPVKDGRYYSVAVSEDTKEAVNRALEGEDYSKGALFFAARKAANKNSMRWFDEKLTFLFCHGGHEFFR